MKTRRLENILENLKLLKKHCLEWFEEEPEKKIPKGHMDADKMRDRLKLIISAARKVHAETHMMQLSEKVRAKKDANTSCKAARTDQYQRSGQIEAV